MLLSVANDSPLIGWRLSIGTRRADLRPYPRFALRLAAAHSTACAVEAVDLMFDAAGGSAIYESNRLERCFRDAHVITHHIGVAPRNIEMVGQYLLGGPLRLGR